MLTFFPKPYPDEILYSIIARYHVWSGNDEMADTMEQLFGNRRERATILIQKHLKHLAEETKKFGLSFEMILYEHTVFPYITCFLNRKQYQKVLDFVNCSEEKETSLFVYKHHLCPKYLKYCPLCMQDDRTEHGEAYWHREHQSYGLSVCRRHGCYLKDSGV